MNLHEAIKLLQNWFHSVVQSLKPALDYIEENGLQYALALAEVVLTGATAGTPWKDLVATLIVEAEKDGKLLAESAASIVLNLVKANLNAQGKATA